MKKIIFFLLAASFLMVGCNSDKTTDEGEKKDASMSSAESKQERNKKVVMNSMESFMKGDMDGVFKDAAPGFIDYTDGSMPPINSIDSLKNFIKMLTGSIEEYKGDNLKYFADGDYVLVTGDWGGMFKKDLMGIKATGKPVKFKDLDMFRLNDEGKIIEHSSVQNLAAVLMTAGMMK
ncbi:MAG TPA: ester cyclase [Chitinophagaceae bacterium]|nr:ester cyclase [Chitinophagaceae bacterium]